MIKFTSKAQPEEIKEEKPINKPHQKSVVRDDDDERNYAELLNSLKDCLDKNNRKNGYDSNEEENY